MKNKKNKSSKITKKDNKKMLKYDNQTLNKSKSEIIKPKGKRNAKNKVKKNTVSSSNQNNKAPRAAKSKKMEIAPKKERQIINTDNQHHLAGVKDKNKKKLNKENKVSFPRKIKNKKMVSKRFVQSFNHRTFNNSNLMSLHEDIRNAKLNLWKNNRSLYFLKNNSKNLNLLGKLKKGFIPRDLMKNRSKLFFKKEIKPPSISKNVKSKIMYSTYSKINPNSKITSKKSFKILNNEDMHYLTNEIFRPEFINANNMNFVCYKEFQENGKKF